MKKMGVIRLVMFTPRVVVIKMSKMVYLNELTTEYNKNQFGEDI